MISLEKSSFCFLPSQNVEEMILLQILYTTHNDWQLSSLFQSYKSVDRYSPKAEVGRESCQLSKLCCWRLDCKQNMMLLLVTRADLVMATNTCRRFFKWPEISTSESTRCKSTSYGDEDCPLAWMISGTSSRCASFCDGHHPDVAEDSR